MLLFAMMRCDAEYFAPKQFYYFNRLRDLWDLRIAAKLAAFFSGYYLHNCRRNYPELSRQCFCAFCFFKPDNFILF
jgi:hypothetical protein